MRTLIIILILTFKQLSIFGSCAVDNRTLTELLFENKGTTIFSCKILTMTTPNYDSDRVVISSSLGGIDGTATAEIITVFFGKINSTIITLNTASLLKVGESYLIYTGGEGNTFYCGGSCDSRTHQITHSAENLNELEVLSQFSDIYKNKKSGKYKFLSSTKKILAIGEFNKGIPVKVWKHYYSNGILKSEQDLRTKRSKFYNSNGYILADNIQYKDSSINLSYSNTTKGEINYRWVTIPTEKGSILIMYEYYKNGNLKLCEGQNNLTAGNSTTTDGKTGKYIEGYENGKVKLTGQYKTSKRVGLWKWYNEDGSFYAEFDYKDGTAGQ